MRKYESQNKVKSEKVRDELLVTGEMEICRSTIKGS